MLARCRRAFARLYAIAALLAAPAIFLFDFLRLISLIRHDFPEYDIDTMPPPYFHLLFDD